MIDLSDPKNVASRGDVPCRYIVEVFLDHGSTGPEFLWAYACKCWIKSPLFGQTVFGTILEEKRYRFARPATAAEIAEHEAKCSAKPLSFGRYVVEGGKAYEMRTSGIFGYDDEIAISIDDVWERDNQRELIGLKVEELRGEGAVVRTPLEPTPKNYALLQAAWVDHFKVKVGTRVRVVRKADTWDLGWENIWTPEMDEDVGGEFPVDEIDETYGLLVVTCTLEKRGAYFPFHVLEVLEPLPELTVSEIRELGKDWCSPVLSSKTPSPEVIEDWARLARTMKVGSVQVLPLPESQAAETPMASIIGKWPGDETDEEIEAALADMDRNPLESELTALRAEVKRLSDACAKGEGEAENKRLREAAEGNWLAELRSLLVDCDSELSAQGHGRPASDQNELRAMSWKCRTMADKVKLLTAALSTSEGGK